MTKDEHRKFQYLLQKAKMASEELDKRFRKIDKMMQSITVGSIVYEADVFDGAYPQRVTEIVDVEQGIIRTYEESIKREREVCVLERYLTVTLCIENCLDCSHCYTDRILTADSFDHEEGAYCRLVEDASYGSFGQNGKHKLIGSDDWHLRNYTKVPDWCPLLGTQNKSEGDA